MWLKAVLSAPTTSNFHLVSMTSPAHDLAHSKPAVEHEWSPASSCSTAFSPMCVDDDEDAEDDEYACRRPAACSVSPDAADPRLGLPRVAFEEPQHQSPAPAALQAAQAQPQRPRPHVLAACVLGFLPESSRLHAWTCPPLPARGAVSPPPGFAPRSVASASITLDWELAAVRAAQSVLQPALRPGHACTFGTMSGDQVTTWSPRRSEVGSAAAGFTSLFSAGPPSYDEASDDALLVAEHDEAPAVLQAQPPNKTWVWSDVFAQGFLSPGPVVVGGRQPLLPLQALDQLRARCNEGYGIVPVSNTFTVSDESKHASVPATPRLPASHERLVLIQVGFSSGRQGAFQSAELTDGRGAASVLGLVGKHVFLTMDGGLDVGLLRAVVPLGALVWHVPELAFVRVLRQASNTQMKKLVKLRKDEERMLGVAADLLAKRPALARNMRIVAVEFQHDYKKLIVYAELTKWVKFNEYVKALRTSCEKEFKAHPRIFIQRKFVDVPRSGGEGSGSSGNSRSEGANCFQEGAGER